MARLREAATLRLSHAMALDGSSDPASDAMIALGGEATAALGGEGQLAGLLVLGPKRSGMPYEDEEMAFLGASARSPRWCFIRPTSRKRSKPSIKSCAARSTRSPSNSDGS